MTTQYVEEKLKEALRQCNGNMSQARQQVITWASKDQALLLGLTKSHLNGIVSYGLMKTLRKNEQKEPQPPVGPEALDMAPESFGKDILKALSGRDSVRFGQESSMGRAVSRKKPASQQHIDTLRALSDKKAT